MTPEAQRIAIAEACGWKLLDGKPQNMLWPCDGYRTGVDGFMMKPPGPTHRHGVPPPDYLNDLNAMHEAENSLAGKRPDYRRTLACIFTDHPDDGYFLAITATAAQRAEAFLRTLNLWDDTK